MAVWLPMAAIDLFRRRDRPEAADRRAILLAVEDRQRQIVASCCERALAAGVRKGMPVGQARALFRTDLVRIEAHDAPRDRAALHALASWARRWSPLVAVDEPDGLLIDITGCERVWKGEGRLVERARADLARLRLRARVCVAPTFGCAWGVARFGAHDRAIVRPGAARESLAPLPIAALRVERTLVEQLAELGIERVGDVLDLPRSTLPVRFGDGLLLQLDRALGQAIETIEPVRPDPPPRLERVFDGPTDRVEAIERTVRDLLDELAPELLSRECGVRVLEVELARSDLAPEVLTITLGRPSRDARHLWRLVQPRLERAHLGFGVEAVRVRARVVGPLRHAQAERFGDGAVSAVECAQAGAELIDTLSNRLGRERVVRAEMVESHLPERAVAWRPALDGVPKAREVTALAPMDRPTVLFDRPTPARVVTLLPDGPVHRVSWRGGEHAIVSCLGPERVLSEWWRATGEGSERDSFCVQTEDGRWLWLCRETGVSASAGGDAWSIRGEWA